MEYMELERLERIIENLLGEFGRLKQEKERLESTLLTKEQEIKELRESVSRLEEEKHLVHNRVSQLISSLERWEETKREALPQPDAVPRIAEEAIASPLPLPGGFAG